MAGQTACPAQRAPGAPAAPTAPARRVAPTRSAGPAARRPITAAVLPAMATQTAAACAVSARQAPSKKPRRRRRRTRPLLHRPPAMSLGRWRRRGCWWPCRRCCRANRAPPTRRPRPGRRRWRRASRREGHRYLAALCTSRTISARVAAERTLGKVVLVNKTDVALSIGANRVLLYCRRMGAGAWFCALQGAGMQKGHAFIRSGGSIYNSTCCNTHGTGCTNRAPPQHARRPALAGWLLVRASSTRQTHSDRHSLAQTGALESLRNPRLAAAPRPCRVRARLTPRSPPARCGCAARHPW